MTVMLASCGGNSRPVEAAQEIAETDATPSVIELTDMEMFPDNGRLVVIDFNASWCIPCRRFTPTFHKVAQQYAGKADFVSVDVDKFPELARKFGVSSIPHITFLQPDGSTDAVVGTDHLADFASLVEGHLPE